MNWVGTRGIPRRGPRIARAFVLGAGIAASLAGCKPKQGTAEEEIACDRESYVAQSREYKASEGEGLASPARERPSVVEGYFGKPYNQEWLAAVGRASLLDTIDFIETKGVRIYHADPISPQSRLNMKSTPDMPWDIEREWVKADKPLAGSRCGFLVGLYLPSETRGIPTLKGQSVIVTREDASRWTLVHEFMHHNFKIQASARGYDDDVSHRTRDSLLRSIDEVKKDRKISDKEYAQKMCGLFQQLIDVADALIVQYQFEEVAVEATLQDLFDKGGLGYVPVGAYANASWYIGHSKQKAKDVYQSMTATYDELARMTLTNGLWEDRWKLDRYVTMRDHRLAQLDEVINRRAAAPGSHGMASSPADAVPAEGHAPCGRAEEIEADLRKIADAMRPGRDGV